MNTEDIGGSAPRGQPETVHIEGVELPLIAHKRQRVVTLAMMDDVHKRPDGTARRTFHKVKDRLLLGEDYFKMSADEFRTRFPGLVSDRATEEMTLLTETGYLMLVKSFQDDLAWTVQRKLVTSYFKARTLESLTANQHGGITKAVVTKALAEAKEAMMAEIISIVREEVAAHAAPSGQFKTAVEFVPAVAVAEQENVPSRGRGGLVRSISYKLDRYSKREGILSRAEAHTDRRLFHVNAVAGWMKVEGRGVIARHMDKLAGQAIMHFPKGRKRKPPLTVVPGGEGA